jgi:sulfatase maturation enzyme AslB (radical SAM superfamily)
MRFLSVHINIVCSLHGAQHRPRTQALYFLLWKSKAELVHDFLHATWKSMIMLQIDDIKNQKFDEIVHTMRPPIHARNTKVHNLIVVSGIGQVFE